MRERRTYGSVRGALSNERPYRDRLRLAQTEWGRSPILPLRLCGWLHKPIIYALVQPVAK
jgi:hypothetical protein